MTARQRTPLHPVQVFRTKALVQALLTFSGKSLTALDENWDCRSGDSDPSKLLHKWARGEHLPCGESLNPLRTSTNRVDELDSRYPGVARCFRHAFWYAVWKQEASPTLLELNLWMLRITSPLDDILAMATDPDTLTRLSYQRLDLRIVDQFEEHPNLDMLGVIMLLIRQHLLFRDKTMFSVLKCYLKESYPWLQEWPITRPFATDLITYIEKTYPDDLVVERSLPRPKAGKLLEQPFSIVVV